jgi:hypothetical protein
LTTLATRLIWMTRSSNWFCWSWAITCSVS